MRTRIQFIAPNSCLLRPFHVLRMSLLFSGLALALWANVLSAAIFKCVDHGQVTYSGSKCAEDAQVVSSKSEPVLEQHGVLTLYLSAQHNYTTYGTINNHSVTFVVDTGASATVISMRAAIAAGIRSCTGMGYSATANGTVPNCVVSVPEITVGTFHLYNITVNILPALSVDALLGMDVLRKMKIQQQGDVMLISY